MLWGRLMVKLVLCLVVLKLIFWVLIRMIFLLGKCSVSWCVVVRLVKLVLIII